MDDKELIRLFQERDERAVAECERKYAAFCRRIAAGMLDSPEDAEECLNDVLLAVWNSIPPAVPEKLDKYLAEIVRNTATDLLRKEHAQKRRPKEGIVSADDISTGAEPVTDPWTDPLGLGKGRAGAMIADGIDPGGDRVLRLMEEYLRSINQKKRKIFFARFYYERSIKDIARIMDLPENTVLTTLKSTRDGLKRFFESRGIEL